MEDVRKICGMLSGNGSKVLRQCVRSYETTLDEAAEVIEESKNTIDKILTEEVSILLPRQYQYLHLLTSLKKTQNDLDVMRRKIEKHTLTAQEMATLIGHQYESDAEAILQEIITLADDEHAKTIRYVIQRYMNGVINVYGHLLNAFAEVAAYVDSNKATVEGTMRNMTIFLRPQLTLQSAKLVRNAYSTSDREWSKSVSLRALTEGNPALYKKKIGSIMQDLSRSVMKLFNDMYAELQTSKVLAMSSLEVLNLVLKPFTDNELDDNFVRNNLALVDIYFGSMEREVVEQLEAYTATNFFSDVGGYLGLLVGASILSVCELIDVGLHICVQHYNRRKQVKKLKPDGLSQKSNTTTLSNYSDH